MITFSESSYLILESIQYRRRLSKQSNNIVPIWVGGERRWGFPRATAFSTKHHTRNNQNKTKHKTISNQNELKRQMYLYIILHTMDNHYETANVEVFSVGTYCFISSDTPERQPPAQRALADYSRRQEYWRTLKGPREFLRRLLRVWYR